MTIILSQADYWQLFEESEQDDQNAYFSDEFDIIQKYPKKLGEGYCRSVQLREGLVLDIANYQLHDHVITNDTDREHPLEYTFYGSGALCDEHTWRAEQYALFGSGLAPGGICESSAAQRIMWLSVHIEPELFCEWIGGQSGDIPQALRQLVRSPEQPYYERTGTTTLAMHMAVEQILQCPYQGLIKRVYLESKVWELMALQLEQVAGNQITHNSPRALKPDDIERIHYAREVLLARLDHPPSLIDLARMVGINDHKLKLGFHQVFGTTVFGYLHNFRMERSRQLLEAGEITVAEASRTVGFTNRGYFAASFKRKFGINPSLYRCRGRSNDLEKTPPSDRKNSA